LLISTMKLSINYNAIILFIICILFIISEMPYFTSVLRILNIILYLSNLSPHPNY
jgi:membrane-bound ClpP family serine protease